MTQTTIDLGKIKFNWRGTYDATASYVKDDVVEHSGSSWVAIRSVTGIHPSVGGIVPSGGLGSGNNPYWDLMALGGNPSSIMTTEGDILVRDGNGLASLGIGTAGQLLRVNAAGNGIEYFTSGYRPGEVIEMLTGRCDGRQVRGLSGTYTFIDTTAQQSLTTSWAVIPSSYINYTPPAGTKYVKFDYHVKLSAQALSGISHYRLHIDGTEVVRSRTSRNYSHSASNQGNLKQTLSYTIEIAPSVQDPGDIPDPGDYISWTTPKGLQWQAREYSSTYQMRLHRNSWWDGAGASGSNQIDKPEITITAIA